MKKKVPEENSLSFSIDGFGFDNQRVFVIAEVGNNHNGDLDLAKRLVDKALWAGADCVKFQMRHLQELYREQSLEKTGEDLGSEYILDLLNRFELKPSDQKELKSYCEENGILYLCTPWDLSSAEFLRTIGVKGFKVASADFTNVPLLERLTAMKLPLILSTGMADEEEIRVITTFLKSKQAQYALLHCNSTYPAPLRDIHLNFMRRLNSYTDIVGYSGHERGNTISLAAVGLGARILERHLTMDREMEGPDHAASLEPREFKDLVDGIRDIEFALGDYEPKKISQGVLINKENLGKSLVASREMAAGQVIGRADLEVKSPGQGLSPLLFRDLIGKKLKRGMKKHDFFFESDLDSSQETDVDLRFSRPCGVPVRYHDFDLFASTPKLDFVEFHLSYADMDLEISDYLKGTYDFGFVVHAPELFSGSHLMDLTTDDKNYLDKSIKETQKVIDITREINKFFPRTERPLIVANVGGFTMDAPLSEDLKLRRYENFARSIDILDLDGVELIPQTMAPFPWHFGGQRFQNIFITDEEIEEWCKNLGLRVCFDVSHSFLACNHLGLDFYKFAERVGNYAAHLHLGDASGVNGEGLQIGQGEINFNELCRILNKACPNASFIPEIWQGHKDGGAGFWNAFSKIKGLL